MTFKRESHNFRVWELLLHKEAFLDTKVDAAWPLQKAGRRIPFHRSSQRTKMIKGLAESLCS